MIAMDPGPIRYRLLQKTNGFLISMPLPAEIKAEYGFDSLPIEDSDVMIFAMYRKDRNNQRLIDEYISYCFKFI